MQKSINSHGRRKKLMCLIIVLFYVLTLLMISIGTTSGSTLESSASLGIKPATEQVSARGSEKATNLRITSTSYEGMDSFKKIRPIDDILYMLGGMATAFLILFTHPRETWSKIKFKENFLKTLHSLGIWKIFEARRINNESFKLKKRRLLTAIPVICIAFAEILIFLGNVGIAVWVHIGGLLALSLSNVLLKDTEVQKVYQALMLLPVLRLINLSMPIFFETTLYAFIFVYGPLAIPVAVIIIHQRYSLHQLGISMKNIKTYMVLSVPLGLVLGLGEYLTIRTEYLISDLTFESLLKLTFIMVFFVGLVEELIFRSIVQTRLEQALGINESLLITSFLFGFMHSGYGTLYEIVYTSFIGFLMGFTFYKTKSLPFVTVLHGFINVFLFGILPHYLSDWTGF